MEIVVGLVVILIVSLAVVYHDRRQSKKHAQ